LAGDRIEFGEEVEIDPGTLPSIAANAGITLITHCAPDSRTIGWSIAEQEVQSSPAKPDVEPPADESQSVEDHSESEISRSR